MCQATTIRYALMHQWSSNIVGDRRVIQTWQNRHFSRVKGRRFFLLAVLHLASQTLVNDSSPKRPEMR